MEIAFFGAGFVLAALLSRGGPAPWFSIITAGLAAAYAVVAYS